MDRIVKRLSSYFKQDWDIEDYPIKIYTIDNEGESKIRFGALVKEWAGMVGHGETKEKAFEDLKENFKLFKDNNELPRPGTKVPLRFALTSEIEPYEDIAVEFFEKILRLNYYDCFVSDESSLANFESLEGDENPSDFKDKILKRVLDNYNVDITNTYDKYLTVVFEKIKKAV